MVTRQGISLRTDVHNPWMATRGGRSWVDEGKGGGGNEGVCNTVNKRKLF